MLLIKNLKHPQTNLSLISYLTEEIPLSILSHTYIRYLSRGSEGRGKGGEKGASIVASSYPYVGHWIGQKLKK